MNMNKTSNPSEAGATTMGAMPQLEGLDYQLFEKDWLKHKRELEEVYAHLPPDVREARISVSRNSRLGIISSPELRKRCKHESDPRHGEIFQGTIGAESIDD